jgi:site-specific recombinase XerC
MSCVDLRTLRLWPGVRRASRQGRAAALTPGRGAARRRLDKLAPSDIRQLVERKAESGLSPQSVRLMHALIRNSLADAEREELVHRNVAKLVRPPSVRREEVRVLTVEDARRWSVSSWATGLRRCGSVR